MPLAPVGELLGLGPQRIRELAIDLAAGGVLSEAGDGALAVWPHPLRSALLHQVFFSGSATDHDYRRLLDEAPSFASAVGAIVSAVHRGAAISAPELRELVVRSRSREVWQSYTALGEGEAQWALEHYRGDPIHIAREALDRAPRAAIPRPLERAVGVTGPLHSQPNHPLRILQDWIQDFHAELGEPIRRRKLLVTLAGKYLRTGGDCGVGMYGLLMALSPRREGATTDPTGIRSVTSRFGVLHLDELREIGGIWEKVRQAIDDLDAPVWQHLTDVLWVWIYPESATGGKDVPEEYRELMHAFAAKVLGDLVPLSAGSPGLAAGLKRLASRIDLDLPLESNPVFELLYPDDLGDLGDSESEALRDLAERWLAERRPQDIAQELAWYEREAARIEHKRWPPRAQELCRLLAVATQRPEAWLDALLDQDLPGDLISPFLEETVRTRPDGWERQVERCLVLDSQMGAATVIALEQPKLPGHLLDRVLDTAKHFPHLIESSCLRNQVPLQNLKALLEHPDPKTALAAARGEWRAETKGRIRTGVLGAWRAAIVNASVYEPEGMASLAGYWLGEILADDSELAFEWLRKLLRDSDRYHSPVAGGHDPVSKALGALEERHRLALLDEVKEPWTCS